LGSSLSKSARADEAAGADVILLDSMGELSAIYRFASVVFVGGSLVPKGGHNILEPAFYARPIVVGPYMENFREIAERFEQRRALIRLRGAGDQELSAALTEALSHVLLDPELAEQLGSSAHAAVEDNRGATARTVAAIARLIA
jgi:3-deoxy-D-manno-octulosonic-acid transferase